MEDISINGEKYVKASLIARELGYTSDYVGQLCRGGKVDAQLVGRSWYVREESLREHKKDRYRSSTKKTIKAVEEAVQESAKKAATVKSVHSFPSYTTKVPSFPRPNYEADYHELLPKLSERTSKEDLSKVNTSSVRVDALLEAISKEDGKTINTEFNSKKVDIAAPNPIKSIPITTTNTPVEVKREQITDIQHKGTPAIEQSEEDVLKKEELATHKNNVFVWGFTVAIAFIIGVAFVGLEAHVFAQQGSVSSTYTFDLGKVLQLPANLMK